MYRPADNTCDRSARSNAVKVCYVYYTPAVTSRWTVRESRCALVQLCLCTPKRKTLSRQKTSSNIFYVKWGQAHKEIHEYTRTYYLHIFLIFKNFCCWLLSCARLFSKSQLNKLRYSHISNSNTHAGKDATVYMSIDQTKCIIKLHSPGLLRSE